MMDQARAILPAVVQGREEADKLDWQGSANLAVIRAALIAAERVLRKAAVGP